MPETIPNRDLNDFVFLVIMTPVTDDVK